MKIEDLDIELKESGIYYGEQIYTYTAAQKKSLIKAIIEDEGKKNVTLTLKEEIMNLGKPSKVDKDLIYQDVESFIFEYILPENKIVFDEKYEVLRSSISHMEIGPTEFTDYITISNDEYIKKVGKEGEIWSNTVVESAFNAYKYTKFHYAISNIKETIKYDEEDIEYLETTDYYLDELFDAMNISKEITVGKKTYTNYREIAKLIFKQTLWLIKRNLFDLPTKNEIMIFFFGEQGIGKSYAFDRIFKTIFKNLYVDDIELNTLLDDRIVETWTRRLVVNFDDASSNGAKNGYTTKDMGTIKRKLSNDTITYRPMNSNTTVTTKKKFTAVSTINFEFKDLIQDESGARRFFQLTSENIRNKKFDISYFDGDNIEETIIGLWKTIDENIKTGFLFDESNPLVKDLYEIQNSYVKLDTLQEWLDANEFATDATTASTSGKVDSFTKCFSTFTDYCLENNTKNTWKRTNFFKELEKRVFTNTIKLTNGKQGKVAYHD